MMRTNRPKRVLIEEAVSESPLATEIRVRLPEANIEIVDRVSEGGSHEPDTLEIVHFRGRFLKSCPGTRQYLCCGYRILHFGVQCTLGCTYCILQAYLNQPNLRLFGNTWDLFTELESELRSHPETLHRIGTGEFTDSLLLDPWTAFSRRLVTFFSGQPHAILELKSKTDHIGHLVDLEHGGNTIAAWSLNAEAVRRREEPKTASIRERLSAASICARLGYYLAFHFDPMIEHPGWQEGYAETVDRLFDSVDASRVVWISLGGFRFMPELKGIIQSRHPGSLIPYGEFIRGLDNKMRYFRDIRVELYRFIAERIRRHAPEVCVYLCMESEDIWRDGLGFSPVERGGVSAMLDRAVQNRMNVGHHCVILSPQNSSPVTISNLKD